MTTTENDACRNLWSAVIQDAFDESSKAVGRKEPCQSEKFIRERRGNFDWICESLGIDPERTSKSLSSQLDKLKELYEQAITV
uniref:Uncharacterized protein n=1 Tax=viral metagenome TaxID=1070528 RepID=A0A6M3LPP3_9ZZZZ